MNFVAYTTNYLLYCCRTSMPLPTRKMSTVNGKFHIIIHVLQGACLLFGHCSEKYSDGCISRHSSGCWNGNSECSNIMVHNNMDTLNKLAIWTIIRSCIGLYYGLAFSWPLCGSVCNYHQTQFSLQVATTLIESGSRPLPDFGLEQVLNQ